MRRRAARVSAARYRRAFSSAMAAWAAKLSSSARSSGENGSASSPERLMVTTPRTRSPINSGWAIAWRMPWTMKSGRASGERG